MCCYYYYFFISGWLSHHPIMISFLLIALSSSRLTPDTVIWFSNDLLFTFMAIDNYALEYWWDIESNYIYNILTLFPPDAPYITPTPHSCLWNVKSPTPKSAVILTQESMLRLSDEICQNFNCGKAFPQSGTEAPPNSTCLTDCIYHNSYLRNCSTVVRNGCLILSEVICGKFCVEIFKFGYDAYTSYSTKDEKRKDRL